MDNWKTITCKHKELYNISVRFVNSYHLFYFIFPSKMMILFWNSANVYWEIMYLIYKITLTVFGKVRIFSLSIGTLRTVFDILNNFIWAGFFLYFRFFLIFYFRKERASWWIVCFFSHIFVNIMQFYATVIGESFSKL